VSVPATFLAVHGICFEDCVEHVCGVDLGGKVAIVAERLLVLCSVERKGYE
jgi:hypothetical protein